jgi:hypothetical protein
MFDANTLQTARSAPVGADPNAMPLGDDVAASLVRAADVGLCVSDETGCCIEINDAAAVLLGMPRADLIGRPVTVLLGGAGADGDDLRSGLPTLRAIGRRVVLADGRTLTVTTLRALRDELDDVDDGDGVAEFCERLSRPVRAIGNFAEIFRARAFGPLGHDRYADFASAILEASRAIERIVDAFAQTAPTEAGFNVLEERTCSLRGLVTAALRRGRVGAGIEVAITGDDMMVHCDPDLVAHALDAMIGPAGLADRPAPRATLVRLVDGRVIVGIHHVEDGYPLGWARAAACLPIGATGEEDADIDVGRARRIFEAHGGGVFVNTEADAGISIFAIFGAGRMTQATARRPSSDLAIRRAIYVDGAMSPALFAALPTGAFKLDAQGHMVEHVSDGRPGLTVVPPLGTDLLATALSTVATEDLRSLIGRVASASTSRGLHEITVEVDNHLRILHAEVTPAHADPGRCWLFLRSI